MLSLNTNIAALTAQRYLNSTQALLLRTTERLSSGLRINSARDDAAGLAISERLFAQIRGLDVGVRNANDAISMAQVGESASAAVGDALQRMRELAVQASNGTLTSDDRGLLQVEFAQLQEEVTRLVGDSSFNGVDLLNNATSSTYQIGPNPGDTVTQTNTNLSALVGAGASSVTAVSVTGADATNASAAITRLDAAIDTVASARAQWGATINRFESIVSVQQSTAFSLTAARSRIMDADFAAETANRSRALILQEFGTAMLAQANAYPRMVLKLLTE
ncbi:MAG: hypothetical protein RL087_825 [Pseudomonadota bacterium]